MMDAQGLHRSSLPRPTTTCWRRRAVLAVLVALAAVGTWSGAVSAVPADTRVVPLPRFPLPPAAGACGPVETTAFGGTSVPLTVSRVGAQVVLVVEVCLDGQAPLPFLVDTGASESVVAASVAARLALPTVGPSQAFAGVGCQGQARLHQVASWSLDGIPLAPQKLAAAAVPGLGGPGQPAGLLGADVLSRFGAVRFDLSDGALVVPGPEGSPAAPSLVTGPTATPVPPALGALGATATVDLRVLQGGGVAVAMAGVRLGRSAAVHMVVDTGSSTSVVDRSLSSSLRPLGIAQRQSTACSVVTVPLVASGPWRLVGGPALARQPVATVAFGPIAGQLGYAGLLGSDVLDRYAWVVLAFSSAVLVLGPPAG